MTDTSKWDRTEADASVDHDRLPAELARRIFAGGPISTVVVDPSGTVVFANERATETLGVSKADLTSETAGPSTWPLTDDAGSPIPPTEHPVTRVFESGSPVFGFEHWIELPDGAKRWLTTNSSPVLGDPDTVEYVVHSFEDVTALKQREERLTSDHMRRLEFRVDQSAVPPSIRVESQAETDNGERRIDIESVVSVPDNGTVQYMGTADLSASAFVTAIEEVPHYTDVRLLSTADGYSRLEARAESATVSELFQTLGGQPCAVIVARNEVRFQGELPGDVEYQRVADGIRQFHTGVELVDDELVYSPHLLADVVTDALTGRQLATLDAAYYSGYFETPRTSTGDELADRFGVTRQTFNQHLRKAQQVVFKHLFEKSAAAAR
ncbi:PAS domain S-box protein [Natronolimnobius sp. AArcel1]|uniref:helix-turn-helix domain-containing protein n=1 Tax=Natronolimnobius sp. AArcel1 TaxID=1679093 RepID=UPI0013EC374C|nr:helix-turn-helix domain-containing protein [Natronolimnobius sp. AArcel1]NGM69278.1 PAS domain S-box protein [Natronolimnobius sp. AArcel1]